MALHPYKASLRRFIIISSWVKEDSRISSIHLLIYLIHYFIHLLVVINIRIKYKGRMGNSNVI